MQIRNRATINSTTITAAVKLLCEKAGYFLPEDVYKGLQQIHANETSELAKSFYSDIFINAYLAQSSKRPICQDTGLAVIFIEIGQQVTLEGDDLESAINEGVRQAYKDGYLRKSVVNDPVFERKNTGDNTPAIIHTRIVSGDKIKIKVAPKGGGSENMSALKMFKPAEGPEAIIKFVADTVKNAGPNPCPPIQVGVGIGGTMEVAALLAKRALLNPVGKNTEFEQKILDAVQATGVGAQGMGGSQTAFSVSVEMHPCHIASMPVAVNINCHAARHAEMEIDENTVIPKEVEPEFEVPETLNQFQDDIREIQLPLKVEDIAGLKAGDRLLLSGELITGRDAAHKKLIELIKNNQELPVQVKDQVIYYVGPCPAKGDEVIGPAGPTTSGRMDAYAPALMDLGLKGMIGKGSRNQAVIDSIKKNKALYFVATGGAACYIAQKIKAMEVVTYPELGPEAIYRLKVEKFPVTVCIDSEGNNIYAPNSRTL